MINTFIHSRSSLENHVYPIGKVYTRFQTKTLVPKNFRFRDVLGVVKFGKYFFGWLDLSGNNNDLKIPDSACQITTKCMSRVLPVANF